MSNATLTRTGVAPAPNATLPPSLSACYKGGCVNLDSSGLSPYKRNDLDALMQSVWNRAVQVYKADNNPTFRVHLSGLYVSMTDQATQKESVFDVTGDWSGKSAEEQDLQKEIKELSGLVSLSYRNIRSGQPARGSNRDRAAGPAFQSFAAASERERKSKVGRALNLVRKPKYPGRSLSEMPLDTFVKEHLPSLASGPPAGQMTQAEREERVRKGDALAEKFRKGIRAIIDREAKTSGKSNRTSAEIAALKLLEQRILERNRFALYCALALADAKAQNGTPEDRQKDAKSIADVVNSSLKDTFSTPPLETALAIYSQEIGDLVLHDRMEYIIRVDQGNGEGHAHARDFTGPSIEEFFTHIMLSSPPASLDLQKALDSLGIYMGSSLRQELASLLTSCL